jgi:hypothetical protein
VNLLVARLLYGSGLRLIECLRLRVKDCDSPQVDGHATAYVCIDSVCRALVTDPEALRVNVQMRLGSIGRH